MNQAGAVPTAVGKTRRNAKRSLPSRNLQSSWRQVVDNERNEVTGFLKNGSQERRNVQVIAVAQSKGRASRSRGNLLMSEEARGEEVTEDAENGDNGSLSGTGGERV